MQGIGPNVIHSIHFQVTKHQVAKHEVDKYRENKYHTFSA